jgi:hypothetical protein
MQLLQANHKHNCNVLLSTAPQQTARGTSVVVHMQFSQPSPPSLLRARCGLCS